MVVHNPLVTDRLQESIIRMLLTAIPHNYSERLRDGCSPAAPYYVIRAEDQLAFALRALRGHGVRTGLSMLGVAVNPLRNGW